MAESADAYSDFIFLLISGEEHKAGRIGKIKKKKEEKKENGAGGA